MEVTVFQAVCGCGLHVLQNYILHFPKCYVELKLDYKGSLDITAKGKFTATVPLPSVGYMFYGIIVELTPSMIYDVGN
ncbi:MAG: hypothetical protein ACLU9V_04390 [Roseburia sp.]